MEAGDILNDRFELIEVVGMGGFSEVWKARDKELAQIVAVKILIKQNEEGIRLCQREFEKTVLIRHSNIVTPYHFDSYGNCPYLAMPFINNGSCTERIGLLSEAEQQQLVHQVGTALNYLHHLPVPIIHGDIKPDNILLDAGHNFYLTDFGISQQLKDRLTATLNSDTVVVKDGITPMAYRPPETFRYKNWTLSKAGVEADIWSFGATLYYLKKGFLPFNGEGGLGQLILHSAGHDDLSENLEIKPESNFVDSIIFNSLQLRPEDRRGYIAVEEKPAQVTKREIEIPAEIELQYPIPISSTTNTGQKRKLYIALGILALLTFFSILYFVTDKSSTIATAHLSGNDSVSLVELNSKSTGGDRDSNIIVQVHKSPIVNEPENNSESTIRSNSTNVQPIKNNHLPNVPASNGLSKEVLSPGTAIAVTPHTETQVENKKPVEEGLGTINAEKPGVKTSTGKQTVIVKPNISIPLSLERNVANIDDLKEGSSISFIVSDNVVSYGQVFLSRGTRVGATIRKIKNGKARVRFNNLVSTGGTKLNKLSLDDFEIDLNTNQEGKIYRPVTSGYQHDVLIN